nr:hypothetical protein [uncultured Acetatifactor sp.]
MDEMVRKTQIYLNTTYRNKPGSTLLPSSRVRFGVRDTALAYMI